MWQIRKSYKKSILNRYNTLTKSKLKKYDPLMGLVTNGLVNQNIYAQVNRLILEDNDDKIQLFFHKLTTNKFDTKDIAKQRDQINNERLLKVRKKLRSIDPLFLALDRIIDCRVIFLDKKDISAFSAISLPGVIFTEVYHTTHKFWEPNAIASYLHELYHQALFMIETIDDLFKGDSRKKMVFSGIMGEDRPAIKTLHGFLALVMMLYVFYWYEKKGSKLKEEREFSKVGYDELLPMATQSQISLQTILGDFTDVGSQVFQEISTLFEKVKHAN